MFVGEGKQAKKVQATNIRANGAARIKESKELPQRSQSVHSRIGAASSKPHQHQQQPGTAFGRGNSTKAAASERRPNSTHVPAVSLRGMELAKPSESANKVASKDRSRRQTKEDGGGTERNRAPGGFAKLLSTRGPIVATYDPDEDKPMSMRLSSELHGESEHLYIGGNEVDVISEDQLDRLLLQAKKARATGSKR